MVKQREYRTKLEQQAREYLSGISGIHDSGSMGSSYDQYVQELTDLLASRDAAVLEEVANLVEVLELGSPSGLSRKEQLRIYDILAKVEKMIRDLAQERRP